MFANLSRRKRKFTAGFCYDKCSLTYIC